MRQYIDVLQDVQGNALVGATVLVQNYIGGGNASIFSDNGLTPISNSTVTSGADGSFSFFAADGDYNLVFSKNSTVYKTQSPVSIFDGAPQVTFADTGTVNTYAISNSALEKALRTGLRASINIANTNTGASTFQYNGLAVKNIVFPGAIAAGAGTLIAGGIYALEYDGTNWQVRNGLALTAANIGALVWPENLAELAGSEVVTNFARQNTPIYDMSRYGIWDNIANSGAPTSDVNSPIIQAVFNMAKAHGGKLVFPYGDYSFYLDTSGTTNLPVIIEGNGSTFRCYKNNPTQSCVIFCNNSGATVSSAGTANQPSTFYGTNVEFRNCNITGTLYSGSVGVTGDVNCAVAFYGASAKFWNCSFASGKVASFFGCYVQYTEFYSCGFYYGSLNATSAGCVLTGYGNSSGSNEVTFFRCYFQLCAIALQILGAFKTRIYGCNMQGNGTAAPYGTGATAVGVLVLGADASGFAAVATTIEGVWFEVNYAPHIYESGECGPVFVDKCVHYGGSPYSSVAISTTYCNDWSVNDGSQYGSNMTASFSNPGGLCKLTYRGNNFATLSMSFSGSTSYDLDVHYKGSFVGTLTGCTTAPTGTFYYTIEGDCVDIHMATLSATSNSTACTITGLPTIIGPQSTQYAPAVVYNSGSTSPQFASVASSTITFYYNNSSTGFTNSGTKGVLGTVIRYPLFT